jgi:hypothetical protein
MMNKPAMEPAIAILEGVNVNKTEREGGRRHHRVQTSVERPEAQSFEPLSA